MKNNLKLTKSQISLVDESEVAYLLNGKISKTTDPIFCGDGTPSENV